MIFRTRPSAQALKLIRKTLRDNPGATISDRRGLDGRMQVSIDHPDPLVGWKRHARLGLLKARAEVARLDVEEDEAPRQQMAALKDRAARARRLIA